MRVSSVSQHIWSLKLKREMARLWSVCWVLGFKSRSLMSQAWSPHKSHVITPVLFSFLPLCRSGYRSAVTFSCNKCFEGKRPDIVLEIKRHMYVCVCRHTTVILRNWPFVHWLQILHYSYSFLISKKTRINPSSPLLFFLSPVGYKNSWSSHYSQVWQWLTVWWFNISYWLTVLLVDSLIGLSQ